MIETDNYWIVDKKFTFKPHFDDLIDEYMHLIEQCNELIFSDYYDIGNKHYKTSNFNQIITLPNSLTHLTFGGNFNQIITLPNSLTHLTFGYDFNQIITLPNSLTHLTFGIKFNQIITLPNTLTHLTFGMCFKQSMNLSNIEYLKLDCNNTHLIENLPNSLVELELNYNLNLELNNLPSNLKKIVIQSQSKFNKELNNLPNSIEEIILNVSYNKQIKNIPQNFKKITCCEDYPFIDDFENYEISHY